MTIGIETFVIILVFLLGAIGLLVRMVREKDLERVAILEKHSDKHAEDISDIKETIAGISVSVRIRGKNE